MIGGPRSPVTATPALAPGGARRTSSIDSLRPDGVHGPVVVDARARDVRADAVEDADLRLVLEGRRIVESSLAGLVGLDVGRGFRRHAADVVGPGRSPLHLLLDDLPGACLVAGYAVLRSGGLPHGPAVASLQAQVDLCAGWAADGTMMAAIEATGTVPAPSGPPAPALDHHPMAPLPPGGMRRARRLDSLPDGRFDAHLRDSHTPSDGSAEMVLHEYTVRGTLVDGCIETVEATAHVLPWAECPGALASVERVRGVGLESIAELVRRDFVGTSTCTHLNDTLRSLADLASLGVSAGGPTLAGR